MLLLPYLLQILSCVSGFAGRQEQSRSFSGRERNSLSHWVFLNFICRETFHHQSGTGRLWFSGRIESWDLWELQEGERSSQNVFGLVLGRGFWFSGIVKIPKRLRRNVSKARVFHYAGRNNSLYHTKELPLPCWIKWVYPQWGLNCLSLLSQKSEAMKQKGNAEFFQGALGSAIVFYTKAIEFW